MLDTLPVIEKVVDTSPSSFTSISTEHERSPWPTDLTESAEGIQPEVSTTRPQPLSENDLAVRLKQAAERRIDDQGDRFALPQFRQLSMDSEWAQELANTLSASQRRLTDAETMGDSARALRDRLTQIFEYQAKIKESMQVGGFTENLPEEALNLIRSGEEWDFERLYRCAHRTLKLEQSSDVEDTIRLLNMVDEWKRDGGVPETVKRKASFSPSTKIRECPIAAESSSDTIHADTVAIPDDSKTKGGTLTLSEILGGNNSSSRHPLAIELMNYASTDAHKRQKTSVREIILSLAHDHELTDFRAECIDAIDYNIDKDMASELQSLADDIKRATKHLDERLGESLRTAIEENRPDLVADTLNYVSSNVRSLRRVDCSALKSVGYNLIELSKLFQTLQDRAEEMGIKE
ncbi:hypothetical protein L486_07765 [Kwoniella mangroviensis CBS 10435]|uniref:Uncharacterized protein n=1 Tax=Kwoniella mangroviensis CBS 10435 TaxID=1331196 RepID=A0A1B9IGH9_9TREE|nr:hypothetical protein L486_07765 [Kwoniella mangroviensis CBS 10435]